MLATQHAHSEIKWILNWRGFDILNGIKCYCLLPAYYLLTTCYGRAPLAWGRDSATADERARLHAHVDMRGVF